MVLYLEDPSLGPGELPPLSGRRKTSSFSSKQLQESLALGVDRNVLAPVRALFDLDPDLELFDLESDLELFDLALD